MNTFEQNVAVLKSYHKIKGWWDKERMQRPWLGEFAPLVLCPTEGEGLFCGDTESGYASELLEPWVISVNTAESLVKLTATLLKERAPRLMDNDSQAYTKWVESMLPILPWKDLLSEAASRLELYITSSFKSRNAI